MDTTGLIKEALAAREMAYAPYSNFKVGAALLAKSGKVYRGANVENISYGLTICAERSAVSAAVSAGDIEFVAIAVATDSREPASPCGACRQVLAEFAPKLEIVSVTLDGQRREDNLGTILPHAKEGILDVPRRT